MIPLSTTTISVLRLTESDLYAEPYAGTEDRFEAATAVRAVIGQPSGREIVAGGEQAIWQFELVCDICDLARLDLVRDDATGVDYEVVWIQIWPNEHIEAGLRLVQGVV